MILNSEVFPETAGVLRCADVLETDYSSIVLDCILLRRSIIGYCPDLDQYIEDRGFYYPFRSAFLGLICEGFYQFKQTLYQMLIKNEETINQAMDRIDTMCPFFHMPRTGKRC